MQTSSSPLRRLISFLPYAVVGVIHLVALALTAGAVATATIPLLMPALLLALLWSLPRLRTEIALLGTLAIVFSWLGDISLMNSGDLGFLSGLGFFLLAHVAYLVLYARRMRRRRLPWWSVIYVLWWIALVAVLAPHTGVLLVPVAIYGLALGAVGVLGASCDRLIVIGSALVVLSDTMLGLHRFLPGFEPWQIDTTIMVAYILGQGLMCAGIVRSARLFNAARAQGVAWE
ncbi:lysoplasmalogenase [Leifsonia sp. Root112D2]|uniref:lysoplasmalogenase n=1 Tax=Leifsonia sp. Root112D2 TaxID=1736426 RepID=UPI0006F43D55|nr:lysoplasmalogenase [Leifsonia sp. Root112D2]KQV05131.1 hypothetical protein ASC63_15160 [Leifsonia sp. Root112D2]